MKSGKLDKVSKVEHLATIKFGGYIEADDEKRW
jgi:hypothetical protein